jgi:hypothetical protein
MAKNTPPHNPILPEHRELFDAYMRKWQKLFNLSDWRVVKKPGRAAKNNIAEMLEIDTTSRLARYRLGEDFGSEPVTPESLESAAIHEMSHLRLHELSEISAREGLYNNAVLAAEHAVITVIEPLLLELAKRWRAETADAEAPESYGGTT